MAIDLFDGKYPIIEDNTDNDFLFPKEMGRGYVPRDWDKYPEGFLEVPELIADVDPSEYDARIDEQEAQKSSLEHVWRRADNGKPPKNLDQNGQGYCWAYSAGSCLMVRMAKAHQPVVRMNPHSVASIIKKGKDEGGWCGLSCRFIIENGMAPEGNPPEGWPAHSMDYQKYDTPEMRKVMANYRVTDAFIDLQKQAWEDKIVEAKLRSVLLGLNDPCQVDFAWWGHSVCALRVVRVERGSYGLLILNSWLNWGNEGMAVLRGSKAQPVGAVAHKSMIAA